MLALSGKLYLTGKFSLSCTLLISAWSEFCRLSSRGHSGHWGGSDHRNNAKKSANTATLQKKIEWSVLPNSYYPYRLHVGVPLPPRDSKGKLCIQTKWPIKGWSLSWFMCIEKLKEYFYSSLDGMLGTYLYSLASRVGTAIVGSYVYLRHLSTKCRSILSADMATDTRPIYQPTLSRYVGPDSAECRLTCCFSRYTIGRHYPSICRSTLGWDLGWYVAIDSR